MCSVSAESTESKTPKYEGLLTSDGYLTTGLVVIVAESCSWLPDNQTNDFCQPMRDDILLVASLTNLLL